MKSSHFKQLNLVAVIERADEILAAMEVLNKNPQCQRDILRGMAEEYYRTEPGDDWEHTALRMCELEILERCMRLEDKDLESAPAGWAGGFSTVTTPMKDHGPVDLAIKVGVRPASDLSFVSVNAVRPKVPLEQRKIALERVVEPFRSVLIARARTVDKTEQETIRFLADECVCEDHIQEWLRHCVYKCLGAPDIAEGIFAILAASIP